MNLVSWTNDTNSILKFNFPISSRFVHLLEVSLKKYSLMEETKCRILFIQLFTINHNYHFQYLYNFNIINYYDHIVIPICVFNQYYHIIVSCQIGKNLKVLNVLNSLVYATSLSFLFHSHLEHIFGQQMPLILNRTF